MILRWSNCCFRRRRRSRVRRGQFPIGHGEKELRRRGVILALLWEEYRALPFVMTPTKGRRAR